MGWSVADTLYDQYERAGVEAREVAALGPTAEPTVESK
jgi:hypothetical protein